MPNTLVSRDRNPRERGFRPVNSSHWAMAKIIPPLVLFSLVITACSCTTTRIDSDQEIWKLHLLNDRDQRIGMIRIQLSAGSPEFSCIDTPRPGTRHGAIIEIKGIDSDHLIGDEAAVFIDGSDFTVDLNLGWCDSNGVLAGYTDGKKAAGEYLHQTEVGYLKLGFFYGHKE